jgi:hypothetical protein
MTVLETIEKAMDEVQEMRDEAEGKAPARIFHPKDESEKEREEYEYSALLAQRYQEAYQDLIAAYQKIDAAHEYALAKMGVQQNVE